MSSGILIGKFNEATKNKVPTFFLKNKTFYYGSGELGDPYFFKLKSVSTPNPGSGMFQAGPVILAFWRDEE